MTTITLPLEWTEARDGRRQVLHIGPFRAGRIEKTIRGWWAHGWRGMNHLSQHKTRASAHEALERAVLAWEKVKEIV
jgi:hypothetical protein